MKIHQINLGDRLGRSFDPLPEIPETETQYFLIVHPRDTDSSVLTDMSNWLNDPKCRGILYVKGVPYAGLSREEAERIEYKNKQRVHFLSYSIGNRNDLTSKISNCFSRFFEKVESENKIDWRLIDEPWPENLLAIYFLAKTLSTVDSNGVQVLLEEKERWISVWHEAKKEYRLRIIGESISQDLCADNASEVTRMIRHYLEGLPQGSENEAISISSKLRHDWLGNEVLLLDAEYISRIYAGTSRSRDKFEERIRPGGIFEHYIIKAGALSATITDAFNPALLIDNGPLDVLSEESRLLIKHVFHNEYQEQAEVKQLSKSIQIAVRDLSDSCKHFISAWYSEPPVGQANVKEGFEEVQRTAKILYELLGKLPKGVVLL